jgi:serine/threonine-protein kinase
VVRAVNLIIQACRGLDAAQAAGIIHRDLKPENLFVCRRGDGTDLVKILDFGIAKLSQSGALGPVTPVTRSGATMGTPFYMPPEQARGAKVIDHRADIYSLGVILFEALSGARPHPGESYNEILYHILTKPPVPIESKRPGLPPDLVELVHRTIAFAPEDRPGSAAVLARALAAHAGRQVTPIRSQFDLQVTRGSGPGPGAGVPTQGASGPPEATHTPPTLTSKRMPWLLVGVAGLAIAGGAAWLARPASRTSPAGALPAAVLAPPVPAVPGVTAQAERADASPLPVPPAVPGPAQPVAPGPPAPAPTKAAKKSHRSRGGPRPEPPAASSQPEFDEQNPYR